MLVENLEEPGREGAGAWKWVSHLTFAADLLRDAKTAWHSSGTVFPLGMWALDWPGNPASQDVDAEAR